MRRSSLAEQRRVERLATRPDIRRVAQGLGKRARRPDLAIFVRMVRMVWRDACGDETRQYGRWDEGERLMIMVKRDGWSVSEVG